MNGFNIHGLADRLDYYEGRFRELMRTGGGALTQEAVRPDDYADRRNRALEMLRSGLHTAPEIARECRMEKYSVYNLANHHGLKPKPIRTWNTWTK
jgi:hypothetical protein